MPRTSASPSAPALGYAFAISLTNFNGRSSRWRWVGPRNYTELVRDTDAIASMVRTLAFTAITVPLTVAGGFALAVLLHRRLTAVGLHPQRRPREGQRRSDRLADRPGRVLRTDHPHPLGLGGGMVIMLAALRGVPPELEHAEDTRRGGGRLAADESLAVLLTTHYLDEADRLASRLAIVDGGRVVAQGTPEELKGDLRGDAVHLELRQPPNEPQARQAMEQVTGLREVALDGRRLSARTDDGAPAVPAAVAALESAGISMTECTAAKQGPRGHPQGGTA